jgi:hypothetical protein
MNYESRIKSDFSRQRRLPSFGGDPPLEEKVKMIVAQQKFLKEIFAEHPKFCPKPYLGSVQPRTELCSGTGLHFELFIIHNS